MTSTLTDECLVHILSFLSTEDLNSNVPFCSHRFREARNHESLDQTRTAIQSFADKVRVPHCSLRSIVDNGWNTRLENTNYTHLKIVGLDRLAWEEEYDRLDGHERLDQRLEQTYRA